MPRTRALNIPGSLQDEGGVPNPPPVPPTLADAIAALVHVTVDNARLLRELAQSNQNMMQGNRGHNHQRQEVTYVDFIDTRPPVFSKADEPLEADDWLCTIEQKFDLIPCMSSRSLFLLPNSLEVQQVLGGRTLWSCNQPVLG